MSGTRDHIPRAYHLSDEQMEKSRSKTTQVILTKKGYFDVLCVSLRQFKGQIALHKSVSI